MKVSELRIGSLVYAFKSIWQVDNTCFANTDLMQSYLPITITQEWLIKLGFKKNNYTNSFDGDGFYYSLDLFKDKYCDLSLVEGDRKGVFEVFLFPYEKIRFKYVHEIQNIYFAITGNELIIK